MLNKGQNRNTLTLFESSEKVLSLKDAKTHIFKIKSYDQGFDNMFQELPMNSISNVVATTGDTHAGKSTVIKALQEEMGMVGGGLVPNIADDEEENHAPTTANVNYYNTRELNGQDVLFLDVEGSNAGDLLPSDEKLDVEKNFKQYGFNSVSEYMEMRRRSSDEHLSRLAYSVSDVIMYVSSGEFENHAAKERAANYIVENATRNIQDILKPSLVLVFNKTKFVYESVEAATEAFFNTHDLEKSLLDYYSTVKVVFLPEMDSNRVTLVTKSGEKKTKQNGEKVFQTQIKVLRQAISDSLTFQRELKTQNGCLLHFSSWGILFQCSINMLNKTKPFVMSSLISDALTVSQEVEYKTAKKLFNNMIQYAPHCPVSFKKALLQSFKMIVAVYFRELCDVGTGAEIGLSNILSKSRKSEILAHLEKQAKLLVVAVDPCTPCSKTFKTKSSSQKIYYCTYSRCSHPKNEHKYSNVEDHYGTNVIASTFRRLIDRKKTTATESGTFQLPNIDFNALKKEGIDNLFEKIFKYYHDKKPSFSDFMVEIFKLQHSISYECALYIVEHNNQETKCWVEQDECPICLNPSEKSIREYCNHEMCSKCWDFRVKTDNAIVSFIAENARPNACIQCVLNREVLIK